MRPPLPPSAPRSLRGQTPSSLPGGPAARDLDPIRGSASLVCPPFPEPPVSSFFSSSPQKHPDLSRPQNETETSLSQSDPALDLPLFPSKLHLEEPGWPCPAPTPLTPTLLPPPGRLQTPRVQRPLTRVPLQTADVRPNQRHGCRGGGRSRRERRLTARWAPPGPSRPHATHGLRPPLPGGGKPGSETGSRDAGEPRG